MKDGKTLLRMATILSSFLLRRDQFSLQLEGRLSWMKWKLKWNNSSMGNKGSKGSKGSKDSSGTAAKRKASSPKRGSDPVSAKEEALKRRITDLQTAADQMESSFFEEKKLHNATLSEAMEAERRESDMKRRANALSREMLLKEEEINAMKISREEADKDHAQSFSLLEREPCLIP